MFLVILLLASLMTGACSSIDDVKFAFRELEKEVELPAELQSNVDVFPVPDKRPFRYVLDFEPFHVTNHRSGTKTTKSSGLNVQLLPEPALKFDRSTTHRHYSFKLLDGTQSPWLCDCALNGATDEGRKATLAASTSLQCNFRGGDRGEWLFEYHDLLSNDPQPTATSEGHLMGPERDLRVDQFYRPRTALVDMELLGGYLFSADGGAVAGIQLRIDGTTSRLTVKSGMRSEERSAIAAATAALALRE